MEFVDLPEEHGHDLIRHMEIIDGQVYFDYICNTCKIIVCISGISPEKKVVLKQWSGTCVENQIDQILK